MIGRMRKIRKHSCAMRYIVFDVLETEIAVMVIQIAEWGVSRFIHGLPNVKLDIRDECEI